MSSFWRVSDSKLRSLVLDGCPMAPNFLLGPVGSTNFMRLSLKKGAHAAVSRAPCRKFGVFAPAYMGRKRVLRMLSLHVHGLLLLTAVSAMRKSVGRGCAPSFSAHVRWGEHGAPVQGRGLRSLLYLGRRGRAKNATQDCVLG